MVANLAMLKRNGLPLRQPQIIAAFEHRIPIDAHMRHEASTAQTRAPNRLTPASALAMYAPQLFRPKEALEVDTKEGKVTASVEEIATYNMLLTEAIYELLADKGIVSKEEVMERVRTLKAETTLNFRRVQ
jgi:hypothetical protein